MATWQDLESELEAWAAAGRIANFWWRDDDAAEPTPALERLLALAGPSTIPLHLAVIPALMGEDLGSLVNADPGVRVLQHGYAHANHAPDGERSAELGAHRTPEVILQELALGRGLLAEAGFRRPLPVLVPPWNRISVDVVPHLRTLGFRALSTFTPRSAREAAPGLMAINTHCDPVHWKQGRRFRGAEVVLGHLVAHLSARHRGEADPAEPTGLLTHHLQMDEPCWAFVDELLARTRAHQAVRWVGLEALIEG